MFLMVNEQMISWPEYGNIIAKLRTTTLIDDIEALRHTRDHEKAYGLMWRSRKM